MRIWRNDAKQRCPSVFSTRGIARFEENKRNKSAHHVNLVRRHSQRNRKSRNNRIINHHRISGATRNYGAHLYVFISPHLISPNLYRPRAIIQSRRGAYIVRPTIRHDLASKHRNRIVWSISSNYFKSICICNCRNLNCTVLDLSRLDCARPIRVLNLGNNKRAASSSLHGRIAQEYARRENCDKGSQTN